jgi:hypothetical protein
METTLADSSCPGLTRASTSCGIPKNEDVDGRDEAPAMTERIAGLAFIGPDEGRTRDVTLNSKTQNRQK